MDNKIFEKVFERIELCGIDFSLIAKVEIKQILAEIYKLGYQQCETDISNDDRYSLREDFEKGNI